MTIRIDCPACHRPVAMTSRGRLYRHGSPACERSDRPESSGVREVRIVVQAPTDENAASWAETIRDLVVAEYGDSMRLEVTILPGGQA